MYEKPNDRVKFLVLLCDDEDLETAKASAGALAMLTSVSKKSCKKVFEVNLFSLFIEALHLISLWILLNICLCNSN